MKTLTKIFKGLKNNNDLDNVENYYGNGSNKLQNHGHSASIVDDDQQPGKYICPMKCEGDKVYDSPGNCLVCNMKLVPVGKGSSHNQHHCC